jgi:predicted phosphoribosyltransferase
MLFTDRYDGGRRLATALERHRASPSLAPGTEPGQ